MTTDTALKSIKLISAQIKQAWQDTSAISFPDTYKNAQEIVIAGMGGSVYSFYVIESLLKNRLTVPLLKLNTYELPVFVNEKTLFIGSSYSGTTEEANYNFKKAYEKGALVMGLSAGGPMYEFASSKKIPYYRFDPKHNPSNQPRMGQGYMLFGVISILNHLGYVRPTVDISFLSEVEQSIGDIEANARQMAGELLNKELVFVGADHLSGNAHIMRNQANETAKLFASYALVPELNHHLMEGLKHPSSKHLAFIFINSNLYLERNRRRMELTKEVVAKNDCEVFEYNARSSTLLGQMVEVLIWGGYMTYYLAQMYKEDPNVIPWVDFFKGKLGKME